MESFYRFCMDGSENSNTAEVMGHILRTEADYRVRRLAMLLGIAGLIVGFNGHS